MELRLYGEVGWPEDGFTAETVARQLEGIGDEDLDVLINSNGGGVFDGVTIYQMLVNHPGMVRVHVQGIAASIASIIAMAGDEIEMAQSSRFMIHNPMGPSAIAFGNSKDLREAAEETNRVANLLDSIRDQMADVYAARTGNTRAAILEWMEAETYFTAQEAMEQGFASSVIPNKKVAASTYPTPIARAMSGEDELQKTYDACQAMTVRVPRRADNSGKVRHMNARLQLEEFGLTP